MSVLAQRISMFGSDNARTNCVIPLPLTASSFDTRKMEMLVGVEGDRLPGTASYMAPQLFNGRTGDAFSDLYALGVTVTACSPPPSPMARSNRFRGLAAASPPPLSRYRPDLPAWLDAVVGKALSVDPTQRFGDVIEFAHELENGAMWAKPAAAAR